MVTAAPAARRILLGSPAMFPDLSPDVLSVLFMGALPYTSAGHRGATFDRWRVLMR